MSGAAREFQLSTTAILVYRAKMGRGTARNRLAERCRQPLLRMARGRLSPALAPRVDPEDIVQETLIRAFTSLERFEPRCAGAFMLYLRTILLNVIRDLERKQGRLPPHGPLEVEPASGLASPVEEAAGRELWERYRDRVERLSEAQRDAVILFVEGGLDFAAIAEALESPSVDAARMLVARGLRRLAELMHVRER